MHEPTNYNFNAVACLRIPFFLWPSHTSSLPLSLSLACHIHGLFLGKSSKDFVHDNARFAENLVKLAANGILSKEWPAYQWMIVQEGERGKEGEQWEKWLTRVLHGMRNEGEQATGAGDSQANFQARLKRLRESLSLLSAGADNPKWVHAKWKRQRNLRSAPTALCSTLPLSTPCRPSQSPYGICLAAKFASKVHEQVEEITNNVRLWCRANCHCNSKTSLCRPQRLSVSNREWEKERKREKETVMQLASWPHYIYFFQAVSSSSLSQTQRLM